SWNTKLGADGSYRLRAVATDKAGYSTTSDTVTTTVANNLLVVLASPGDVVRGTVPVTATFDPVGSTSTLVVERFRQNGMEPSRAAATLLLGYEGWIGAKAATWQFTLGTGMACAVTALPVLVMLMEKLEILRQPYIKDGHAIGQIIEYAGPAVEALSVDERATMTNMAAEVGAFTGIVAPDAKA
ncbi:MAG: aconitase family protein, partial [Gammaproteobacteria bacterium]